MATKAVMMQVWQHTADPADPTQVRTLVQFRIVGNPTDLGTIDANVTITSSDTAATITTKIQNAIISRAAEYGVAVTADNVIPFVRGVPQALMSSNSTTITLTDDGLNQTITGGLGNLIFAGFSAGMQIASHLAVASASVDPGIALSAADTFANGGSGIVGKASATGGFSTTGVVGTGISEAGAVADSFGIEGSTLIRGTGKTMDKSVGVVAKLVHIGTDATTVLNRWSGHRADAPSGDPMTLTDWVGFDAPNPGEGTNRWALQGYNKIETKNSDVIASGSSKGFIGQYSDQAGRYFRLRAIYNIGVPALVIDDVGTTLPAQ